MGDFIEKFLNTVEKIQYFKGSIMLLHFVEARVAFVAAMKFRCRLFVPALMILKVG